MDLHRKTERKDLLTEHLYTIIRENELRKAKKLEELMVKLNVGNDVGFSAQNEGDEAIMEQNNSEISVLSEDKARREIPESCSALHPCHAVEDKTPIEQTEVDMAKQKMLSEAVSEKEVTVPT